MLDDTDLTLDTSDPAAPTTPAGSNKRRKNIVMIITAGLGACLMVCCATARLTPTAEEELAEEPLALAATEDATEEPAATPTETAVAPDTAVPTATLTDEELVDQAINAEIAALTCTEESFMARQERNSGFMDPTRTSLAEQTVTFTAGFAETEPTLRRRLLEETARVFRDFPCIGNVRVVIEHPAGAWVAEAEIGELEALLGVEFEALRADIAAWREFVNGLDEAEREAFVAAFVTAGP